MRLTKIVIPRVCKLQQKTRHTIWKHSFENTSNIVSKWQPPKWRMRVLILCCWSRAYEPTKESYCRPSYTTPRHYKPKKTECRNRELKHVLFMRSRKLQQSYKDMTFGICRKLNCGLPSGKRLWPIWWHKGAHVCMRTRDLACMNKGPLACFRTRDLVRMNSCLYPQKRSIVNMQAASKKTFKPCGHSHKRSLVNMHTRDLLCTYTLDVPRMHAQTRSSGLMHTRDLSWTGSQETSFGFGPGLGPTPAWTQAGLRRPSPGSAWARAWLARLAGTGRAQAARAQRGLGADAATARPPGHRPRTKTLIFD